MATVQLIDGRIIENAKLTDIQSVGDEGSSRATAHIEGKTYSVFNSIIDGFNPIWQEQISWETHQMLKGTSHEVVEGSATSLYEEKSLEPEEEEEQENEGWKEYWLVVGGVSHLAEQAIESVGGRVERLMAHRNLSTSVLFAVCLLHDEHDQDDDQGFGWFTDDGEKARKLYVCSSDAHHDLYIYCVDGSVPRFETSTPELRIITEAEWFAMDEEEG